MSAKPTRFTLSSEDMLAFENLKPRVDELCEREVKWEARIKALEEGLLMRTSAPSDQQIDRRARVALAVQKTLAYFDPAYKNRVIKYGVNGFDVIEGDNVLETNVSVVTLFERVAHYVSERHARETSVPRQLQPKPLDYPDF